MSPTGGLHHRGERAAGHAGRLAAAGVVRRVELDSPPADAPWPLIAIEEPCAIRGRALAVLDQHGIPATVVGEAAALGGVLNATRAGLGISLLALAGPPPEGLVELRELPPARSISLTARARHGADQQAVRIALRVLHATLEGPITPPRMRSLNR